MKPSQFKSKMTQMTLWSVCAAGLVGLQCQYGNCQFEECQECLQSTKSKYVKISVSLRDKTSKTVFDKLRRHLCSSYDRL